MDTLLGFIHWNAKPEMFQIGPISVRWYGLLFASGFLVGYYIVEKMFKEEKENEKWLDSLFLYMILATVIGARLGHVFFYGWDYYSQHPIEIFKVWQGGLASHGGTIGIILAMLLYSKYVTKRTFLWVLDRVAVPTALVACFIRLGNLMNSEIYGIQTSMPWGFIFERNGETVAKHPTQIYEALSYLITFGIMMYLYWKVDTVKKRPGLLVGLFLILVFASRFLIEFIKEDQEAFEASMQLNMGQLLSIPFVLMGSFLLIRALKLPEKVFKK
jgi:phosphatidylglycerol---prolipoprotein diacylglyceryl transferase